MGWLLLGPLWLVEGLAFLLWVKSSIFSVVGKTLFLTSCCSTQWQLMMIMSTMSSDSFICKPKTCSREVIHSLIVSLEDKGTALSYYGNPLPGGALVLLV